jgi:hypothetical protein
MTKHPVGPEEPHFFFTWRLTWVTISAKSKAWLAKKEKVLRPPSFPSAFLAAAENEREPVESPTEVGPAPPT